MRRQQPLYQIAVEEAMSVLAAEVDLPPGRARKVVEAVVRAYNVVAFDAANASRRDHRLSPVTKRIMEMELGARILLPSMAMQDIRARMRTVRTLTGEPDRKWRMETQHDGKIMVTRIAPEDPQRIMPPESKAVELAGMKAGQEKIGVHVKSVRGKGQVCSSTKVTARKLLDESHAQWTFRSTDRGVLIKRIR